MASTGSLLRELREQRGVSLEDVARSTRINPRFLEALEADDLAALPAGPFAKGFIRAYCEALGASSDAVLAQCPLTSGDPGGLPRPPSGRRRVPLGGASPLLVEPGPFRRSWSCPRGGDPGSHGPLGTRLSRARCRRGATPGARRPTRPRRGARPLGEPARRRSPPARRCSPASAPRSIDGSGGVRARAADAAGGSFAVAPVHRFQSQVLSAGGAGLPDNLDPGPTRWAVGRSRRRFRPEPYGNGSPTGPSSFVSCNAGGVTLELNGRVLPPLGARGTTVHRLVLPTEPR